jgi:hypothetical protein
MMTTGLNTTNDRCGVNELSGGLLDEIVDICFGRPGLCPEGKVVLNEVPEILI